MGYIKKTLGKANASSSSEPRASSPAALQCGKIIDLPYSDRRIILVVQEVQSSSTDSKRSGVAATASTAAAAALACVFPIALPVAGILAALAAKKAVEGSREMSSVPSALVQIPLTLAQEQLRFPPAHPLPNHVYVGHPLVPERYVPMAAFHRYLFEEKVNELMKLLASLGATRVAVTHVEGYRQAAGVRLSVEVDGEGGGAGVRRTKGATSMAHFEERYRPKGEPKIPTGLIWIGHEPSWQALAERRLEFGTTTFAAELRYDQDYGISAEIKAMVAGIGVELGGDFSEFRNTVWQFSGEFA